MKRYLITVVGLLLVLAVVWDSFAQEEGKEAEPATSSTSRTGGSSRRGMWRQQQVKAVAAMQEQVTKIKSGIESFTGAQQNWRGLSDDERNALREKYRKAAEERQQSLAVIEEQIAKLKGARRLREENEKSIDKLKAIRQVAEGEKAAKTVEAIDKLIAEQEKEFKAGLKKLGLTERSGRRAR